MLDGEKEKGGRNDGRINDSQIVNSIGPYHMFLFLITHVT